MSEVRLIDANALKELEPHYSEDGYRVFYEYEIDTAPTVCGNNPKWCESCVSKGKCASTRPQGEWIDANKQIPEDCITVLIWFEYYRYGDYNCMYQTFGLGYTIDGKWSPFINGETGWRDAHIIAWQPIEPYGADMKGGAE